ncbi:hypothetical protein CBOM_03259 [Ceraceosorus bombacis]|uniref:Uncharacterized protein n=1 Tax=Ceraceosorus bombacis TaxID=401625 RepID=A0A0P1BN77_9BASI|nr:hypothetical protein CBOM_03259 [Ceraceosorus bombacis]
MTPQAKAGWVDNGTESAESMKQAASGSDLESYLASETRFSSWIGKSGMGG